jgi:hypothetical protein
MRFASSGFRVLTIDLEFATRFGSRDSGHGMCVRTDAIRALGFGGDTS